MDLAGLETSLIEFLGQTNVRQKPVYRLHMIARDILKPLLFMLWGSDWHSCRHARKNKGVFMSPCSIRTKIKKIACGGSHKFYFYALSKLLQPSSCIGLILIA